MDAEEIELIPVGGDDEEVLPRLRRPLEQRFRRTVRIGRALDVRTEWFDSERRQYRGDAVLDALVSGRAEAAAPRAREGRDGGAAGRWRLGVIDADIFVPGLNFIFGQATVGGCCAVVGLTRLRPTFYGEPPDPKRFRRRVLIEAVHELGHVAGLAHCPEPSCVMYFSNSIEETDAKGPDFCPGCGTEMSGPMPPGAEPAKSEG